MATGVLTLKVFGPRGPAGDLPLTATPITIGQAVGNAIQLPAQAGEPPVKARLWCDARGMVWVEDVPRQRTFQFPARGRVQIGVVFLEVECRTRMPDPEAWVRGWGPLALAAVSLVFLITGPWRGAVKDLAWAGWWPWMVVVPAFSAWTYSGRSLRVWVARGFMVAAALAMLVGGLRGMEGWQMALVPGLVVAQMLQEGAPPLPRRARS